MITKHETSDPLTFIEKVSEKSDPLTFIRKARFVLQISSVETMEGRGAHTNMEERGAHTNMEGRGAHHHGGKRGTHQHGGTRGTPPWREEGHTPTWREEECFFFWGGGGGGGGFRCMLKYFICEAFSKYRQPLLCAGITLQPLYRETTTPTYSV